jgi:PQQ-dependent dehydrogenase (methanol/ethanol family)
MRGETMKTFHAALLVLLFSGTALAQSTPQNTAQLIAEGRKHFESRCGGCHGGDGRGGERGPDVITTRSARRRNAEQVRELIREGLPDAGMPGFSLPGNEMTALVTFYRSQTASASEITPQGDPAAGEKLFFGKANCHTCHVRGGGGMVGPDLSSVGASRTLGELESDLKDPVADIAQGYGQVEVKLKDGELIRGFVRNQSAFDLQLQTVDGRWRSLSQDKIAELTRKPGSPMPRFNGADTEFENLVAYLSHLDGKPGNELRARYVRAQKELPGAVSFESIRNPAEGDWPSYNGRLHGNRHSSLSEIKTWNAEKLVPEWIFPMRSPRGLETTPIVVAGIMYVTAPNEVRAVDARVGREIWSYSRRLTDGVMGDAGAGTNRGAAILGDRVFIVTDNANLLALDRLTGQLLWEADMADHRDHYGGTLAPLVVNDLVIAGVGGGDEGIRGFLAAYKADTGEEAWRFWTVPLPGEPLSETWVGSVLPHGCAGTWLTGTYDPELDLLYWPTGNPCPDMNGDERKGDNLYSDSILAIEPSTGKLRWHYQYTPHDLYDWDANQTPMLIDTEFQGSPRKLLVQANRNGFFYVLDRTDGEVLLAKPFVEKMTWATGIGPDGRPQKLPGKEPTYAGNEVCPSLAGATNWMAPAYSPSSGLVYVQTVEQCNIYTKRDETWQRGKGFFGGASRNVPGERPVNSVRAIKLETGEIVWDRPHGSPGRPWTGVLSTDGGVIFYGDGDGTFTAADASNGNPLWHFHTNERWRASPMTYLAGGKQFVAVAAGFNIIAFALPAEE